MWQRGEVLCAQRVADPTALVTVDAFVWLGGAADGGTGAQFGVATGGIGPDGVNGTARATLERLLHPMTIPEFFSNCWEKKHCLLERRNASYHDSYFAGDDLDKALTWTSLPKSSYQMHRDGFQALPYPSLIAAYLDGASLVFNGFQTRWDALWAMCASLQGHFYSAGINLYLSPKNGSALSPHTDAQDKFILQVSGREAVVDSPNNTCLIRGI